MHLKKDELREKEELERELILLMETTLELEDELHGVMI